MLKWLRRLFSADAEPIHPPWRVGQYATYYLGREDGSWAAIELRLCDQKEGAWLLAVDVKTPLGECMAWVRLDPSAPADVPDFTPGPVKLIQGSPLDGKMNPETLAQRPEMFAVTALNLLVPRRSRNAQEALRGEPRQVSYPCEITQAHSLPKYPMHHDLHPRVMLTGVACLSIDDAKNPLTVTSFGWREPGETMSNAFEDFIDFSHLTRVEHEGFAVTYPATWFLRPEEEDQGTEQVGLRAVNHSARQGGVTCSAGLSITILRGTPEQIIGEQAKILARLENLPRAPNPEFVPREPSAPRLPGDAKAFEFDFVHPAIDGLSVNGVFRGDAGGHLAQVNLFGCIAKANPRREQTLAAFRATFPKILESFHFT